MVLFLIYSFFFLCIGGALCTCLFELSPFALFSWSTKEIYVNPFLDWQKLYTDFQHNNWAVDSLENLIIFFVFIFFFPLWIALWFLVKRIPFKKIFLKPVYLYRSHVQSKKISTSKMPVVSKGIVNRPIAMRKTPGGMRSMDNMNTTENVSEKRSSDSVPYTSNKPSTARSLASYKNDLFELGQQYGYELFEKVKLDEWVVPFVLATDTVALVMTILDDDKEWIADETTSDGEEPTWFSAEGLIPSPFSQMVKASDFLKEKEPDSVVVPVVVLANGTILNVSNIKEQWNEKGGAVVLWKDGKAEGLDSLEDLLRDKNSQDEDIDDEYLDIEDEETDADDEKSDIEESESEPLEKEISDEKSTENVSDAS